jgi:ATP-dependent DNA ligase
MLCYPFEEKRLLKWKPPYIVQPKLDGDRCLAIPLNGNYLLVSSEGNIFHSVPHINEALKKLYPVNQPTLDGELYIHGASHESIHSIVSREVNIHPDYRQMEFHVFDLVDKQKSQAERLLKLPAVLPWPLHSVDSFMAASLDGVMSLYDQIIEDGYEGIIVRHLEAPYEEKRSRWLMKFKPKQDDWYDVVGWQEEVSKDGVEKGRLGALVCTSDEGTEFSVGSGLTDYDREILWKDRDLLAGRKCHVQYQHITSGKGVPRFPVFVQVK